MATQEQQNFVNNRDKVVQALRDAWYSPAAAQRAVNQAWQSIWVHTNANSSWTDSTDSSSGTTTRSYLSGSNAGTSITRNDTTWMWSNWVLDSNYAPLKSAQWLSNTYNYTPLTTNTNSIQPNNTTINYYKPTKLANLSTYQFWTQAELAEKNSPWYLDSRNTEFANAFLDADITDLAWIKNYLQENFEWYKSYDVTWQNNTAQKIYDQIQRIQSQRWQQEETPLESTMLQWQFLDAVNSILENNYWLWDLDSIKDMFWAETYYNIKNALESVQWVWDATDPASRSQLEWYLQQIIGSAIWTASEQSELNLMMSSVLSKFTDQAQKQIQQDVLAVQNLKTRWYTVDKIASETWMSKDQVNQLVLLSQWLPSQIGKYYEMNNDAEDLITEDYERNRENLEQQYKFNLEVANQELTQMREDFNKTYLDQQEANENTLHNMDLIAWMTGTWYSRRWLEGMSYAQQQANAVLNNLLDNYDRNNLDIANSIKSMTMAYQQNDAELVDQMNDAILNAKNNYIAQVSNIQAKYGLVWLEWQQAIAQAVQWFVNQAETIYNNAFNRAWTNTNNLISAVSSIWAIEQQQMQTKQMKIAEFQQDSMYMTQNQLRDYAQKNGLNMEYSQLVAYQLDTTVNTLTAKRWIDGTKYAEQINQMLSKWYTPQQALYQIVNSPEWQADIQKAQQAWNWKLWSDWITYNTFDWTISWWVNGGYSNWWYYDTQAKQQAVSQVAQQWIWQYSEWQQINKQCWAFVNDYLESMWLGRVFTDPIEKKKAAINTQDWYSPQVWDVVVMESPYEKSKQYGHVAIVTGINNDGTMNLARANTNWDKAYHTWKKAINSKDILGYYSPAIAAAWQNGGTQQQSTQATGYDETMTWYYNKFLSAKMTKDDWNHIWDESEFKQMALNYRNKINNQVTAVADTMLRNMIELRNWLDWSGSMTWLRLNIPTTDAHKYRSMYEQIKANDALQNLINLKSDGATFWALSDQELWFITDAANWFKLSDNEKNFKAELNNKINKLLNKYWMSEQDFLSSGRGSESTTTVNQWGGRWTVIN